MKAIGIMSGTSLDGVDVCVVDITKKENGFDYSIDSFKSTPYSESFREKIKKASSIDTSNVQLICSLNFEISLEYKKTIDLMIEEGLVNMDEIQFIAMHGQTVWHNPIQSDDYVSSTLQLGEPSVLAYAYNKRVISNFRTMDIASKGTGAPLIPFVDYLLYSNDSKNIALQNIGGIGNVCYLKKNGTLDDIIAFDTGPGNMLIDLAMKKLFNKEFDENGNVAKKGKICNEVLNKLLEDDYFLKPLPKSTGREVYNDAFLDEVILDINKYSSNKEDIISTITAFTAYSIIKEYNLFLNDIDELIISGGGAHNEYLVGILKDNLNVKITIESRTDAFEAFGFAILGHMTLLGIPSNVRSVTGALKNVVLGNITNPPCKE